MGATTPQQDHFAQRPMEPPPSQKSRQNVPVWWRFSFSPDTWPFLALLAIIAFIPRLLLAWQLDVYTDEPIYVAAGNGYILLLKQLNITSANWLYNNEHPAFAKLLMGMFIYVARHLHTTNILFPARLISVLLGTILVVGIYALGRAPFGRTVALLAALSLAFSPWVVYFSGLAMLDMTMTALISLAYLLLWHAIHRPRLYALSGILIGLAGASKYPAALMVRAFCQSQRLRHPARALLHRLRRATAEPFPFRTRQGQCAPERRRCHQRHCQHCFSLLLARRCPALIQPAHHSGRHTLLPAGRPAALPGGRMRPDTRGTMAVPAFPARTHFTASKAGRNDARADN